MVTEEACRPQRLMEEKIAERTLITQNTTDCYPNRARCSPTRNPANLTRQQTLVLGRLHCEDGRMKAWLLGEISTNRWPSHETKLGRYFKDDNSGCISAFHRLFVGKPLKCYLIRASNAEGCWQNRKKIHRTVSIKSKPGQWWKKPITKEPLPYRHPEKWVF